MADGEGNSIEWEAIRRNWPVILTLLAGVVFAIEQWDILQDHDAEIKALQKIISTEGIVAYEKWRTKVDLTLENYCK